MTEKTGRSTEPLTRRELLNFVWVGSLGVFLAEFAGVGVLFAFPRFREGEFGGVFRVGPVDESFPEPGGSPVAVNEGKFWAVRTQDNAVLALYRVCPHLGCFYNWQGSEQKFICPCHGSQFQLNGTYIQGPAPRSADRFVVRLLDEAGSVVAETDQVGDPLPLPEGGETLQIVVDTGQLIRGKGKNMEYPITQAT